MRIGRRQMLRRMGKAGLAACLWAMPKRTESQTLAGGPNIVLIIADDLGYGDVGCYGQERIQTPCLDRMASEGMRFTQCYAGSAVCSPSRCSLLTGLHTGHSALRGNMDPPIFPHDITVADVLRQAGYRTCLIGKWGSAGRWTGNTPLERGFDEYFGYLHLVHAHDYYPFFLWENGQVRLIPANCRPRAQRTAYSHDLFTDRALAFIEGNRDRPFFLLLAYTIPHADVVRTLAGGNGMVVPDDTPYSDEPWPQPQKNQAAMISRLDRDVGRVLDLLTELGIAQDTLVFFCSDNGPHAEGGADPLFFASAGPFRGGKRSLYEGGIRVPMIAWQPGTVSPGAVSNHVCALWDILPTIGEVAGAVAPQGLDGISMTPTLLGEHAWGGSQEAHAYLYWELPDQGLLNQAVRVGNWKGVRADPGRPFALYDLASDPGETTNLAAEEPDIAAAIAQIASAAHTPRGLWRTG